MPEFDLGTARGKIDIDSSSAVTGAAKADAAVSKVTGNTEKAASSLIKTGTVVGGVGAAAAAGLGLAVKSASDFEKGVSAVGAVSGASAKELDQIRTKALQLGADTKFSAGEAVGAMEELVKAGVSVDDVMHGAADATVALAAAGEIDLPQAATISANAMNAFGLAAKDLPHVADLIAGAANASAIDVSEFGQSLQQSGAVAHTAGVSFDDLSVAIAEMGNAGIKGSDAGTSLKTFIQNLIPQTKEQTTLMQKLGLVTKDGANQFFDATGKLKPFNQVAQLLQDSMKGLTKEQQLAAQQTLFGSDAIRASSVIAEGGAKGFNDLAGAMGKVSAQDVAAKRMDNFAGSVEQLKGSIETMAIQVGRVLLPTLRSIVDFFTKLVNAFAGLPAGVQKGIVLFIAFAGALALVGGALIAAVGFALKLVEAFKAFKAAIQFVKGIQMIQRAFALLNVTMLANPVFLVIAALVALGVAFFILYKKVKPVRDFIDGLWQAFQRGWDKVLAALEPVINFFKTHWKLLAALILAPIAPILLVIANFTKIKDAVVGAISFVVNFIKNNWTAILVTLLTGPVGLVLYLFRNTFAKIIEAVVGFIGSVVQFFSELPGKTVHFVVDMVEAIVGFIGKLPERILYIVGYLIGLWIKFWIEFYTTAFNFAKNVLETVLNFLLQLPGRILGILQAILGFMISSFVRGVQITVEFASNVVRAIVDFIGSIPGRVADFFGRLPGIISSFAGAVFNAATGVVRGIVNAFANFGGEVVDMVSTAIRNVVSTVANAGGMLAEAGKKAFGGLISGVKDALFGSPHTKIEYWVWDMVDNVTKSTGDLAHEMGKWQSIVSGAVPSAQMSVSTATGAGVLSSGGSATPALPGSTAPAIGSVVINNPSQEPAEDSLFKTGQQLAYLGAFN